MRVVGIVSPQARVLVLAVAAEGEPAERAGQKALWEAHCAHSPTAPAVVLGVVHDNLPLLGRDQSRQVDYRRRHHKPARGCSACTHRGTTAVGRTFVEAGAVLLLHFRRPRPVAFRIWRLNKPARR